VFAAYEQAAILGTRAEQFVRTLLAMPAEKQMSWLEQFEGLTTPLADPEALILGTPDGPAELTEDPPEPARHSARSIPLRTRIRAARIARDWE
jgi:hypothetical protein